MAEIDWGALTAPFTFDEIHWRIGPMTKDKTKTKPLPYIDARDVMDRFDAVCGHEGWGCEYSQAGPGVVCSISVWVDGRWVTKSDGAGATDIEGVKGAYSDAFKRAAVRWGVGRYLYGMDAPWVGLNPKYNKEIDPAEMPKLRRVYDALLSGKIVPNASVGALDQGGSNKDAKAEYERIQAPLKQCNTMTDLRDWKNIFGEAAGELPEDMRASLRGEYNRLRDKFEAQP